MTFDLLKVLFDTEALRRSSPTYGQEQVIELDYCRASLFRRG